MAEEYYGQPSADNEIKTVQERCREFYAINDFVVVMNIDRFPFVYQVQRVENQSFDQPDPVHMNITNIKNPERIILQPAESRLVPAYEADLMIKSLMDKIVYRDRAQTIVDSNGEETPKDSVMDPATQRKYIKKIYQGKRDFMQEYNDSLKKPDVAKDLEDDSQTEAPRRPGRPAKQTA